MNVKQIYQSKQWSLTRKEQLEKDHFECQRCKHQGKYKSIPGPIKYSKAVLVHHDFRLRQYPQYAFASIVDGKRNLYSLCQSCHEIEHEKERALVKEIDELNEEKW